LPLVAPGSTDGCHVARKGIKAYGFMPTLPEPGWNPLELAHAPNERISLANVEYGSRVFWDVLQRFCVS
jgi:acetylornithine deacetylase/succinyl-diaminopimelate desuccinylase-like protein